MKKTQQKPKENVIDILKPLAKRIEEATVDIHDMRFDLKSVKIRLSNVESNTEIMKIDTEKIREELVGLEIRLSKRITYIADLITIQLGDKLQKHEKRIVKLEQVQQTA